MTATDARSQPLSPLELTAWRGLLRVHARLVSALDAELRAEQGISLVGYEVLLFLSDAPNGRLRMHELAEAVLLSRSGLTRVVDELERRGWVSRERCDTDGRGTEAVLTREGRAMRRRAQATHLRGVRERFHEHLDRRQLEALADVWKQLGAEPPGDDEPAGGEAC